MRYDYACDKCETVLEVTHGMLEKPTIKCDKCHRVMRLVFSVPMVYVRGYGWCDKKGAKRDMNLWKLKNEDPYAKIRPPGDKSDLEHKLTQGGKRQKNRRHYAVNLGKKKK
jgi:putative FmdB family regulatory protein